MANQSTKDLIQIADIKDNVVLLKNGSLRTVIEVSAINFELRSDDEQVAILLNFQRFLNSVDFPLQIVINSRRYDIDDYLKIIQGASSTLTNELLRIQATEYTTFVRELSDLSNIMSKKFYIVIPFYVYEAPSKAGLSQSFKSMFGSSSVVKEITDEQLRTYQAQLIQRAELVFDGLIGLGLKASLLSKEALTNLYYGLYNHSNDLIYPKASNQISE